MRDSGQLTFTTMGGDTVMVPARGKHHITKRGYARPPGTGPTGETCGSCQHHARIAYSKTYHKCYLQRAIWTGGARTDILVRSPACEKWQTIALDRGEINRNGDVA